MERDETRGERRPHSHCNRAHARSAATVRDAERFVQIEMRYIAAVLTGFAQPCICVDNDATQWRRLCNSASYESVLCVLLTCLTVRSCLRRPNRLAPRASAPSRRSP